MYQSWALHWLYVGWHASALPWLSWISSSLVLRCPYVILFGLAQLLRFSGLLRLVHRWLLWILLTWAALFLCEALPDVDLQCLYSSSPFWEALSLCGALRD
jgi:hypothetical protein